MKGRWKEAIGSGADGQEAGLTWEPARGPFQPTQRILFDPMIAQEQTVWGPLWNATAMIGHGVQLS